MTHERCSYPNCICIKMGSVCIVAEAADKEPYCSFCFMPASAVMRGEDCGHYDVCSKGGAVMVIPVERAVVGSKHIQSREQ